MIRDCAGSESSSSSSSSSDDGGLEGAGSGEGDRSVSGSGCWLTEVKGVLAGAAGLGAMGTDGNLLRPPWSNDRVATDLAAPIRGDDVPPM